MPLHLIALSVALAFLLSACQSEQNNAVESEQIPANDEIHDHSQHQHTLLAAETFSDAGDIPSLIPRIEKDPISGWNIHLQTENFSFTPARSGQMPKGNSGHAHIFVDGYKIARIYGEWFHLNTLTPGQHAIRISLNADNHAEWSFQGKVIESAHTISQ